jgi:hypothetical protein
MLTAREMEYAAASVGVACWVMIQILSPKRKADFWRSEAEARRR